jgi:hypothetical protein
MNMGRNYVYAYSIESALAHLDSNPDAFPTVDKLTAWLDNYADELYWPDKTVYAEEYRTFTQCLADMIRREYKVTQRFKNLTVYLDMDGVLADFDKFTIDKIGRTLNSFDSSKAGWDAMKDNLDVYKHLEIMPNARIMVDAILELSQQYGFRVAVLTGIPRIGRVPHAQIHKKQWIDRHFPELSSNFNIGPYASHKQYHCNPLDVLIDDMDQNIEQWNQTGYGIVHTSAADSLTKLVEYLTKLSKS